MLTKEEIEFITELMNYVATDDFYRAPCLDHEKTLAQSIIVKMSPKDVEDTSDMDSELSSLLDFRETAMSLRNSLDIILNDLALIDDSRDDR